MRNKRAKAIKRIAAKQCHKHGVATYQEFRRVYQHLKRVWMSVNVTQRTAIQAKEATQ